MIQVYIPHAIHMPFSFQRKEKEMNEKGGSKGKEKKNERRRSEEKNRKGVNKVFGMGV